jgi:hypothetical protein
MITKKAIHIWVLLILCIQVLYSQRGKDFFEVDNYIENNKSILCNISFDELPYKLTLPHWNDSEKARAIFYYLVTNYTYDYSQLENRDIAYSTEVELEAMNAFLTKKGTCYGLSCLFQYLAIEVGVESKIVEGSVKVKDASTQKLETHKDDHSWNAIFVDGHPYYIDISLSITNKSIFENFNNYWFLVLPEKFILSHFPKKEVDQGIRPPIDYNAFLILPYIESNLLNVLELDEIIALSSAIKNDSSPALSQASRFAGSSSLLSLSHSSARGVGAPGHRTSQPTTQSTASPCVVQEPYRRSRPLPSRFPRYLPPGIPLVWLLPIGYLSSDRQPSAHCLQQPRL